MDKFELECSLSDDCQTVNILHGKMLARALRKWEGKELQMTLQPLKKIRSNNQNRYIHGPVVNSVQAWLQETTGKKHTHDEVYTWLRVSLLNEKPEVVEIDGREMIMMTGKRFSAMSTKEFADAIDTILSKMAEKGCYIADPRGNNLLTDYANIKDE